MPCECGCGCCRESSREESDLLHVTLPPDMRDPVTHKRMRLASVERLIIFVNYMMEKTVGVKQRKKSKDIARALKFLEVRGTNEDGSPIHGRATPITGLVSKSITALGLPVVLQSKGPRSDWGIYLAASKGDIQQSFEYRNSMANGIMNTAHSLLGLKPFAEMNGNGPVVNEVLKASIQEKLEAMRKEAVEWEQQILKNKAAKKKAPKPPDSENAPDSAPNA